MLKCSPEGTAEATPWGTPWEAKATPEENPSVYTTPDVPATMSCRLESGGLCMFVCCQFCPELRNKEEQEGMECGEAILACYNQILKDL